MRARGGFLHKNNLAGLEGLNRFTVIRHTAREALPVNLQFFHAVIVLAEGGDAEAFGAEDGDHGGLIRRIGMGRLIFDGIKPKLPSGCARNVILVNPAHFHGADVIEVKVGGENTCPLDLGNAFADFIRHRVR